MYSYKMRFSHRIGILEIPAGLEIPETREIPEPQELTGNSCTENSQEGKAPSHTGGREQEFTIEHPCYVLVCMLAAI